MEPQTIKQMIEDGISDTQAYVSGDGRHFKAIVISDAFVDQPLLAQHQMVYATLGDKMREEIHALSIKTYTEAAWAESEKKK